MENHRALMMLSDGENMNEVAAAAAAERRTARVVDADHDDLPEHEHQQRYLEDEERKVVRRGDLMVHLSSSDNHNNNNDNNDNPNHHTPPHLASRNERVASVATRLRDLVAERRRNTGKSLGDIFTHFDREGRGSFGLSELLDALESLCVPVNVPEAKELLRWMARDGFDNVSFGEFATFVE
jgi:hypothetical protein